MMFSQSHAAAEPGERAEATKGCPVRIRARCRGSNAGGRGSRSPQGRAESESTNIGNNHTTKGSPFRGCAR